MAKIKECMHIAMPKGKYKSGDHGVLLYNVSQYLDFIPFECWLCQWKYANTFTKELNADFILQACLVLSK